jgi:hypothetical protein
VDDGVDEARGGPSPGLLASQLFVDQAARAEPV